MKENTKNIFRSFRPCIYISKGGYNLPKTAEVDTFENMENRWLFDLGWGNYNPDSQAAYFRKNAWYLPHGGLRLIAQREDWNVISDHKYYKVRFTSGCLTSKKKYHFGQFIWDAQFPIEIGCWGALWLWGANGTGEVPKWYGEIDFEQFNKSKSKARKISTGTYVGETHPASTHNNSVIKCVKPYMERMIYKIDWQKNYVAFYINGMLVMYINDNIPQREMRVVMNLAVGKFDKMKDWSDFGHLEIVGELRIHKFIYIPNNK